MRRLWILGALLMLAAAVADAVAAVAPQLYVYWRVAAGGVWNWRLVAIDPATMRLTADAAGNAVLAAKVPLRVDALLERQQNAWVYAAAGGIVGDVTVYVNGVKYTAPLDFRSEVEGGVLRIHPVGGVWTDADIVSAVFDILP